MPLTSASPARRCLQLVAGMSLVLLAPGARCEPEVAHWSAYLRAQPSQSAAVIDEIRHGALVDVGRCGGDWCQVKNGAESGWIDKGALSIPTPPRGAPSRPADCAWAFQSAYPAPEATRFCHTKSPGS